MNYRSGDAETSILMANRKALSLGLRSNAIWMQTVEKGLEPSSSQTNQNNMPTHLQTHRHGAGILCTQAALSTLMKLKFIAQR